MCGKNDLLSGMRLSSGSESLQLERLCYTQEFENLVLVDLLSCIHLGMFDQDLSLSCLSGLPV